MLELFGAFIVFCVITVALGLCVLFVEVRKQQRNRYGGQPRAVAGQSRSHSSPVRSGREQELHGQLIKMLGGDRGTAERLLENTRSNHPGRSEQWHLEKVIFDLERDRRI